MATTNSDYSYYRARSIKPDFFIWSILQGCARCITYDRIENEERIFSYSNPKHLINTGNTFQTLLVIEFVFTTSNQDSINCNGKIKVSNFNCVKCPTLVGGIMLPPYMVSCILIS